MQKESLIGKVFAGKFKVTGFLGEGGMGRIYLADEMGADRQIALKVLHAHLGGEEEVVKRFDREMRAAASVQHPSSVRVHEYGDYEGRLFLSMEFVDGDSLGEVLLDDAPFPAERVAHIARQIAAALGAAHSQGIVHRDLKPDNVMIGKPGEDDEVKVCDFGLARFVGGPNEFDGSSGDDEDTSDFHTAVGVRVGTPHYMSPEYITVFSADHRADLYALGVLMYEMAAGKPPFDGRPYEVLDKHVTETPVAPSIINDAIPAWLDEVILKLLEKKPEDRYQVAEEVLVKLQRDRGETLDDEEVSREEALTEEAPLPMSVDVPETRQEKGLSPRKKSGGSSKMLYFVAGGIALMLVGTAIAFVLALAGLLLLG